MTLVVMTRFAVEYGQIDVRPVPLSPTWFTTRFALFEQYCLPSLQAQTDPAFRWRLYIAPRVDQAVADRLSAYDPRIEVRRDSHYEVRDVPDGPIATLRVDSDDAISAHMVAQVREVMPTVTQPTLVDFARGYHVHHGRQEAYIGAGRAFKALIEPQGPHVGVYVKNCDVIGTDYPVVRISAPSWLRIVHGGNMRNRYNRAKGSVPVASLKGEAFPWIQ